MYVCILREQSSGSVSVAAGATVTARWWSVRPSGGALRRELPMADETCGF